MTVKYFTVKYFTGDMLTSTAPALGHGVNIKGQMGAGIAKAIRKAYPEIFAPYAQACRDKSLTPGHMLALKTNDDKWILNLASQDKLGRHARLEWLRSSLIEAFVFCEKTKIDRFALPRIGAGIGGLKWEDVKDILEDVANDYYPVVQLEVWSL